MKAVTPAEAKRLLAAELERRSLGYERLTARTVNLDDLARARPVFVTVHGWVADPQSHDLQRFAREHGFRVQFRMNASNFVE